MADIFRVTYTTKDKRVDHRLVSATTAANAWTATQSDDAKAKDLISITRQGGGSVVSGS